MAIELNQTTFKRLVWLYLALFALTIGAAIYETIAWSEFSDAFYRLTFEYFGHPKDAAGVMAFGIGLAAVGLIAHMVAAVALLGFHRWGRWLIWVSLLMMLPAGLVPGLGVSWTGYWTMWLEAIVSALFGAILLLAYANEFGAQWFEKKVESNLQ